MTNDIGLPASPGMTEYFRRFRDDCLAAYALAREARKLGYDPEDDVSAQLACTLAERVIGLVSVIAPQVKGAGIEKRIEELEKQYGVLDWRVSFVIAHEIAQQKFCAFKDELEAMTVGVRVGFAYHTLGVVSAPLEGLHTIELKGRLDGKGKYFCLNFAGPIRNAGGTAAAVCVLIADYVRKKMGYATYDPTEKEIARCAVEIADYHERVMNLQYFPSEPESVFLMQRLPVEIGGEASEKFDISNINLKDLPRVPTNQIRSGYCLIHSACIPLKAPKLWKQLEKWGDSMDMGHWRFMKEFCDLQKRMKAGKKAGTDAKIVPDYTYIKDLVAGRPVLGYPLRSGGFRLRYGRSRASGYSGQAIHPCTMVVLDDFVASATQLKVERPGKAASYMPCDTLEGPIVRLNDGTVLQLQDETQAREIRPRIERILYLGDVLVNYGDFYNRNHSLVPAGYCPEWWAQEVERAGAERSGLPEARRAALLGDPLHDFPTADEAIRIARATGTPIHPAWTPFWSQVTLQQLKSLFDDMLVHGTVTFVANDPTKETLEILGIPHRVALAESLSVTHIVPDSGFAAVLAETLALDIEGAVEDMHTKLDAAIARGDDTLGFVNTLGPVRFRDRAGTFIGARMGRPEKAKMRKLTGSPHCLFPIGAEGGRLRSVQEALAKGRVTADFPLRWCPSCRQDTVLGRCESCDGPTESRTTEITRWNGEKETVGRARQQVDIRRIFNGSLKKLGFKIWPDLIKGVRGTSNKSHIPEHLIKGILRAKHGIAVNKDGTTRYDCSETVLTHFRPDEIGVPAARLRELGYATDCSGKPLDRDDQVVELRPQDIVIPCCPVSPDEPADQVLFRIASFIDEELQLLYGLPAQYNLRTPQDIVGHYVVGLAPHTSAGMIGRIIGFSKTQGFLAHPLYHAAMRRDCDGDESCFILLLDALLNFSAKFLPESRGSTMDAPLVITYLLNPAEVDDMAFHVDRAWRYPLELYELAQSYRKPYDIRIPIIEHVLNTPEQFEGMGFTHDTASINAGVLCSAYKTLPSMQDKLRGQMALARKIRACDASDVARLVIEKHFIRDTKGNLRKFTQQEWRCVDCNEKFRRPPLIGRCTACGGKILFTISEGSVTKYLEPSISIAKEFNVSAYLQQDLQLLARKIEDLFGKDKETQTGLGAWFG